MTYNADEPRDERGRWGGGSGDGGKNTVGKQVESALKAAGFKLVGFDHDERGSYTVWDHAKGGDTLHAYKDGYFTVNNRWDGEGPDTIKNVNWNRRYD